MATFMDTLNEMTRKSKSELRAIVDNYSASALHDLCGSMSCKEACTAILTTVLTTISSDGYSNTDEFYVAKPVLDAVFECDMTYDDTLNFIREAAIDSDKARNAVDYFVDHVDSDTKYALFIVCGAICAADKVLNNKELSWLDRLLG